jgi:small subunit ribosomal protein S3
MSHRVHPYSHRLGIIRDWKSRWFANGQKYRDFIKGDMLIRKFLDEKYRGYSIAGVEIERSDKSFRIVLKTSRPGMLIGKGGDGVTKIKEAIFKLLKKENLIEKQEVRVDIEEVRSPESNALLVAQSMAEMLEKRMTFRRVMKQTIEKCMANRDVKGVRVALSGRLGGADMSRKEGLKKGRIPLQTFRADIDFARYEAHMTYGQIGIKVWIYRGEIFGNGTITPDSRNRNDNRNDSRGRFNRNSGFNRNKK